jgi:hypothetical protein
MEKLGWRELIKWGRDIIISVILVPAILLYFDMTPIVMILGAVVSLMILSAVENWQKIHASGLQLGPAIVIAVSLAGLLGGGIWAALTWQAQKQSRPSIPTDGGSVDWRKIPIPTIPTLFMTDFLNKGSGGGAVVIANGYSEFNLSDKSTGRIFFNVIQDFGNQSKFLCLYIPRSPSTFSEIKYLAANYKSQINSPPPMLSGTTGSQTERTHHNWFSRVAFLSTTKRLYLCHSLVN